MAVLECVKLGAKLGQLILAIDEYWITKERSPNCSMQAITSQISFRSSVAAY
jgi:hypothetical protein